MLLVASSHVNNDLQSHSKFNTHFASLAVRIIIDYAVVCKAVAVAVGSGYWIFTLLVKMQTIKWPRSRDVSLASHKPIMRCS